MKELINLSAWQALIDHQKDIQAQHMRDLCAVDRERASHFTISAASIHLDYSYNLIVRETMQLLHAFVEDLGLSKKITELFQGGNINLTEKRPALHTALRDLGEKPLYVNKQDVKDEIHQANIKIKKFVGQIHTQKWLGVTGKPITYIVNIGIGGSYTGPMMGVEALKDFAITSLKFFFLASIDPCALSDLLKQINPEETLFIISSKSFTTIETLTNAHTIADWLHKLLGQNALHHHMVAVTANEKKSRSIWLY